MLSTDLTPSTFVESCVRKAALPPHSRALDIACGYGRNAIWLARKGYFVEAIDIDADRIEFGARNAGRAGDAISWRVADIEQDLRLETANFDLAIIVHYYSRSIIRRTTNALRPGGYLLLETFGAHGENWRGLPVLGEVKRLLPANAISVHHSEKKVGPDKDRAVVRLFVQCP
jgi:2-polyprenyl-3-methyl-5-hydroxy-6-metoxy-1,4-benzoquinol methylase